MLEGQSVPRSHETHWGKRGFCGRGCLVLGEEECNLCGIIQRSFILRPQGMAFTVLCFLKNKKNKISFYILKEPGFLHVGRGRREGSKRNRKGPGSMDDSNNGSRRIAAMGEAHGVDQDPFRGKEGT